MAKKKWLLKGDGKIGNGLALQNVLYILSFTCNLVSVHQLANDRNCIIIYGVKCCFIQDLTSKTLIGVAEEMNAVYYFEEQYGRHIFCSYAK